MSERKIFQSGGRNSGKTEFMRRAINKHLDENPNALICVVSLNGIEFIENAEFVEVTNLIEPPAKSDTE